jgi:hypothetical protein
MPSPVQCFPEHSKIKKMNAACKSGDVNLLQWLVAEWRISLDPPSGYEIYASEPAFYFVIRGSQSETLEYLSGQGMQLCRLEIQ